MYIHTWTSRLLDQLGPEGQVCENGRPKPHRPALQLDMVYYLNRTNMKTFLYSRPISRDYL